MRMPGGASEMRHSPSTCSNVYSSGIAVTESGCQVLPVRREVRRRHRLDLHLVSLDRRIVRSASDVDRAARVGLPRAGEVVGEERAGDLVVVARARGRLDESLEDLLLRRARLRTVDERRRGRAGRARSRRPCCTDPEVGIEAQPARTIAASTAAMTRHPPTHRAPPRPPGRHRASASRGDRAGGIRVGGLERQRRDHRGEVVDAREREAEHRAAPAPRPDLERAAVRDRVLERDREPEARAADRARADGSARQKRSNTRAASVLGVMPRP